MDCGKEKSLEDVKKVIKAAKLHESELTEISQVLRFPKSGQQNELKLLMLDSALLKEIEAGNRLMLKGDADDNVVLCTKTKTYDIREAETSNSLLLLPNLLFASDTGLLNTSLNNSDSSFEKSNTSLNKSTDSDDGTRILQHKDILNTFFTYYEPKPCKPRLGKLRKLLEASKYCGPELEYSVDKDTLLNKDNLVAKIQASELEIEKELIDIQAVKIDGFYRLLDFDFEFRVLSYMLDLIEENSWDLNQISKEDTVNSLKELVPIEILDALFDAYTENGDNVDGVQLYKYREEKVCGYLARVLLKSAGKFNLAEFLQAWRDSVPEGMNTDESYLSGIALIDKSSSPQVIWGYAEADLPEDINERFQVLFQAKPKWTVLEISPYIQRYATEKMNVNALLTKHARASTLDGVRVFSSKHLK